MPEPSQTERDLQRLESELKRLEAEYNMYFAGRLPKPPWETRARVQAIVKQFDRAFIRNTGDRFRFETLQSRYATFIDLWDRGLRAREEGRSGPFVQKKTERTPEKKRDGDTLHVASFKDPVHEIDKLTELYESLTEARRSIGEESVPFHKFADLVRKQVKKLRDNGSAEVAFRVAVKDGKVNFTAKALKEKKE
ncbi:MAG TPA: MXAN_5187 C-terminal domain-containing protein [Vicinamibacterales bacterium]